MRNVEIIGTGTALPRNYVTFNGEKRYRVGENGRETELSLAVEACRNALETANLNIRDVDLIVSASAVGIQPIPCSAALIHEQIAKGTDIPAMDIGTTCTSFITALDTVSYLIHDGRYQTVLIVSCDLPSCALNPDQRESFELFGDGAAAVVCTKSRDGKTGILYSLQKTWSEGAHSTEIRGGLTAYPPRHHTKETETEYFFDMKGREVLTLAAKKLPQMFSEFYRKSNLTVDDVDVVVPHQASKALKAIMNRVGVPEGKYIDDVSEYGNMVSAAVPFAFCKAVRDGRIQKGNIVLLCGTAAGLTANILALRY
ncbi:MAG: 3-oxoacyl-[acyl-carrier-protein] synthase III C-terminal domain-containing protein [Eubacteriales bacterium]